MIGTQKKTMTPNTSVFYLKNNTSILFNFPEVSEVQSSHMVDKMTIFSIFERTIWNIYCNHSFFFFLHYVFHIFLNLFLINIYTFKIGKMHSALQQFSWGKGFPDCSSNDAWPEPCYILRAELSVMQTVRTWRIGTLQLVKMSHLTQILVPGA